MRVMDLSFIGHTHSLVVLSATLSELAESQAELKQWHLRDNKLIPSERWISKTRRNSKASVHGVVAADGRSVAIEHVGERVEIWSLREKQFQHQCVLQLSDPNYAVQSFSHSGSMISTSWKRPRVAKA